MTGKVQPTQDEIEAETQKFQNTPSAQLKEDTYVHEVYNEIASHFSQTRYKPWPIVADFLETRSKNSIGVDVGCGNGKYLSVNPKLFIVGSDYSTGLISQAWQLHNKDVCSDVMVADGLNLPHESEKFDFAISIAVIHHFSTEIRRIEAIEEILRILKKGGQALIYCWALEQENSRRGYHEGMDQDILVPWVLADKQLKSKDKKSKIRDKGSKNQNDVITKKAEDKKPNTKMRFYHLYKKGELNVNCIKAGGNVVREGYERDNWWAVVEKI